MSKVYQHMQPGESLGKITFLKYIDDVSDDELILYVFEDGTKCNEQYVAEINNKEAFGKYFITELTDPLNKWEFKTTEYDLNKTQKVVAADGREYEMPQPGITKNGEHISIQTSDSGAPISKTMPFEGKRIEAIPPREIKNKKVEPKENYLLSLHPELLDSSKHNQVNENLLSKTINKTSIKTEEIDNTVINKTNTVLSKPVNMSSSSPITTNIIETVKHASIIINLDDIIKHQEYDTIKLINNGKTEELTITEFINRLNNIHTSNNDSSDDNFTEDILITNMIDKSKKKECTIGIDMKLELPPKEVYKTIRDIYSEELAEQFVLSVAHRINSKQLKQILGDGLSNYYEKTLEINNKIDK